MLNKNIYPVKVVGFKKNGILVHGNLKTIYNVPVTDFSEEELERIQSGALSDISVYIHELDPLRNQSKFASYKKAQQEILWNQILDYKNNNRIISGKIVSATKGGYNVLLDLGITAFMPSSLINEAAMDGESLINTVIDVYIVGLNKLHKNVVVSRKAVLIHELDKINQEAFDNMAVGAKLVCIVKGVTNNGIYLNTGHQHIGFVSNKEASYKYALNLGDLFPVGMKLEAVVKEIHSKESKFIMNIKELHSNPFNEVNVGDKLRVRILFVSKEKEFGEKNIIFVAHAVTEEGLLCKIPSDKTILSEMALKEIQESKEYIEVKVHEVFKEECYFVGMNKVSRSESWKKLQDMYEASQDKIFDLKVIRKSKMVVYLNFESINLFVPINELSIKNTQETFDKINIGELLRVKIVHLNTEQKEALLTCKTIDNAECQKVLDAVKVDSVVKCKLSYKLGTKRYVILVNDIIELTLLASKLSTKIVETIENTPEEEFTLRVLSINLDNLRMFVTHKVKQTTKKAVEPKESESVYSDLFDDLNDIIDELS